MSTGPVLDLPDGSSARLRRAAAEDLAVLVAMLVDDPVSAVREDDEQLDAYASALAEIDIDPHQLLVVAEMDDTVVGMLQLTVIPGLARHGARRGQLETVRVASSHRCRGLGTAMVTWAAGEARERGCSLVQLTSDKHRTDAHRFYDRLGFDATHEGYKLIF